MGLVVVKLHWGTFFSSTSDLLPILIPVKLLCNHLLSGAGTISQLVADVPPGLSHPTPPHPTKFKEISGDPYTVTEARGTRHA
jgi:hypothetical protein